MQGFEMHRLLTGRSGPNIVVFSNILWDLGRWLFLSEVADSNQWVPPLFLVYGKGTLSLSSVALMKERPMLSATKGFLGECFGFI